MKQQQETPNPHCLRRREAVEADSSIPLGPAALATFLDNPRPMRTS